MKVYAFVPAKEYSERVENKNKAILNGEMLYAKALKTLLKCKEIDEVILDSDSQEMYDMVDYLPVTFMKRDPKLATNSTDGHALFMNEVNLFNDGDIYVQLLCTSPFINHNTIDNAIRLLKSSNDYDSAILMRKDKFYMWKDNRPTYDINHIPNSKDLEETIIESMGLYIIKRSAAMQTGRRFGNNPYFIFGDLEELIDVNSEADLKFAQIYANGIKQKNNEELRIIKHFISSPVLADLLDDLAAEKNKKCGAVISGLVCNLKDVKLLGRAKTIKLRALKDDDDENGIYKALDSYKSITENDIIIVENELKNYAYFGDLNARLAIRSGASGAIIDGLTRDSSRVQMLNFPVFSRGYTATDVKRRATLDHMNKPISFANETIFPDDLIFVDECAMIVIYQKYEREILSKAFEIIQKEKNIVKDVWLNLDASEIIKTNGFF